MSEAAKQTTAPTTSRPRIGFLGVGWIGRHRMQAINESGHGEVAAIADTSPTMLASAAVINPQARLLSSLDELLETDVDAVVIATPSALHRAQAIAALARGKAVFCQKPLGRTAVETSEIVQAARHANRLLAVDLSYRFTDGMQRIYELIRAGALGRVYAVNLVFHNAYGPDKPWFYDAQLSGGGCVIDLGIHLVDLALWALDWPRARHVTSRLFTQGEPLRNRAGAVEDYATAQMELEGGTAVQLACSWKLQAGCACMIEASFYGTAGGASFRNVNGSFYDFTAERFRKTSREVLAAPPDAWGGRAAIDWARRLGQGDGFNPEVERLVDVMSVLDQIYERHNEHAECLHTIDA
jgi:predicted dehydrogenase